MNKLATSFLYWLDDNLDIFFAGSFIVLGILFILTIIMGIIEVIQ